MSTVNVVITADFPRYFRLYTGLEKGVIVPMWQGEIHYPEVHDQSTSAVISKAYTVDFWPNNEGECFVQAPYGYEKTFVGLDGNPIKHFVSVGFVKLAAGDYAIMPDNVHYLKD